MCHSIDFNYLDFKKNPNDMKKSLEYLFFTIFAAIWDPLFTTKEILTKRDVSSSSQSLGVFQLIDLIITELKSHMTGYNLMPLIG